MVAVLFVLLDEDAETMGLVGARRLNPLGVRRIGFECLGQGSAAHLCCLRRSVWLLLMVCVYSRSMAGWLACCCASSS
ncbi:hypothetical protein T10_13543 [Trichinella papuae]|uniref:Uncharacterized protein n=1 Tax=Trichinella papuae TaxID=268474 RepID=A0A0V1MIX0_9BILA|nr:hypothetical protein T10_13543 [Trichinella papuae]